MVARQVVVVVRGPEKGGGDLSEGTRKGRGWSPQNLSNSSISLTNFN